MMPSANQPFLGAVAAEYQALSKRPIARSLLKLELSQGFDSTWERVLALSTESLKELAIIDAFRQRFTVIVAMS
jgi:hypothetical protein